ncbi:hypothetical protein Tcan_12155 [Toxocara canis]|uniref:Transthyretin-like protein 46 n=1 Tax=Toxocara canis TaxID=6265 RepID=A0A0B2UTX6_TOXCA|nr:hypothetical protein Tcan_12155 [Toxocara canis]
MKPTFIAVLFYLMQFVDRGSAAQIKAPVKVNITGRFTCQKSPAYAVLVNLVEEVEYTLNNTLRKGRLRVSYYFLSDRDGNYTVEGIRFSPFGRLFLNTSHHCIPNDLREYGKNCLTRTTIKVHNDPSMVHFEMDPIELDDIDYQGEVLMGANTVRLFVHFGRADRSLSAHSRLTVLSARSNCEKTLKGEAKAELKNSEGMMEQ